MSDAPIRMMVGASDFQPVIVVLVIAGIVVIGVLAWLHDVKRRRELEELALGLGLEFDASGGGVDRLYAGFAPFDRGHSRSASNLISGVRDGLRWEIFDYKYVTGSGKSRTTHRVGVVGVVSPLVFPKMKLRPETLFDRVAEAVGIDDIDFESDEFSRAYHVTGADRKAVYDLIHPGMMEYLLRCPRMEWEFAGVRMKIHRGRRYSPREIMDVMAAISGFLERVPEFVRQDRSARGWASP